MKSQNGKSQLLLIIAVLLIIVASIYIVNLVKEQLNKKTISDYETDMLMIQGKTKIIDEEVNMKKEGIVLEGKKISENIEKEEIKQILDKKLISQEEENFEKYYMLENEDLEKIGLSNIKLETGFYIINYTTDEVIYSEGISDGKNIYYKLSEIKELENTQSDGNVQNIENAIIESEQTIEESEKLEELEELEEFKNIE